MDRTSSVNVTALRQNLPAYLAKAQRGERLRVTSRGRVIAEIGPATTGRGEAQSARERLRGSVLRYDRALEPVIEPREWEANR